jgi:hypothetical protein
MRRTALALLALITMAACTNWERENLLGYLDDFDEVRGEVNTTVCGCYDVLGFDTQGQCVLNQLDPSEGDKECIADAFDKQEELGSDYYGCLVVAMGVYVDCLDGLECAPDWNAPCVDEYEAYLDTCPVLSSSLQSEISSCLN